MTALQKYLEAKTSKKFLTKLNEYISQNNLGPEVGDNCISKWHVIKISTLLVLNEKKAQQQNDSHFASLISKDIQKRIIRELPRKALYSLSQTCHHFYRLTQTERAQTEPKILLPDANKEFQELRIAIMSGTDCEVHLGTLFSIKHLFENASSPIKENELLAVGLAGTLKVNAGFLAGKDGKYYSPTIESPPNDANGMGICNTGHRAEGFCKRADVLVLTFFKQSVKLAEDLKNKLKSALGYYDRCAPEGLPVLIIHDLPIQLANVIAENIGLIRCHCTCVRIQRTQFNNPFTIYDLDQEKIDLYAKELKIIISKAINTAVTAKKNLAKPDSSASANSNSQETQKSPEESRQFCLLS